MNALIQWAIAHPEQLPIALGAAAALARVLYAVVSRIVAPYPRLRALVEALAAASPDVIRAAQQLASAVLGRPVPTLDARAPDDDREALRAEVTRLRARVADLMGDRVAERDTVVPAPISPRSGQSGRADVGLLTALAGLGLVAALAACPRLPERVGCAEASQACIDDAPHVCSATGRYHRAGDLACARVGGVCTVTAGRAYCAPAPIDSDAGAASDAGDVE